MHHPHLATRCVYVLAWSTKGELGFDWFRTRSAADDAYATDPTTAMFAAPSAPNLDEVMRFDVTLPLRLDDAAVNDYIDVNLDALCEQAATRRLVPPARPRVADPIGTPPAAAPAQANPFNREKRDRLARVPTWDVGGAFAPGGVA